MTQGRRQIVFWLFLSVVIFFAGYYLRGSLSLHHALAFSPYEAFKFSPLGGSDIFSEKLTNYPLGLLAEKVLNPLLGNFYLIYILGGLVIFFLGKKISQSNLGGILAFALFAVAPENLIQYTGRLYASGLCYVAIWAVLLFFLRYLENKKNLDLLIFVFFGIIAIASYHTGASAFIVILLGLFFAQLFSQKPLDKKMVSVFLFLSAIYGLWLMIFDFNELWLVSDSFSNFIIWGNWQKIIIILTAGFGLMAIITFIKNKKPSLWWLGAALLMALVLIFSKNTVFQTLLALGVSNYYASAVTLNNYLGQIILIHIFFLLMMKEIFKDDEPKNLFLRGWFFGLIIIFAGLLLENYYTRIIDFSAPLMFVIFGWYLSRKPKFWKTTATLTLILMFVSQIMIYKDPFTMRRYYNQSEIDSAKKVVELHLPGITISDVRTAALMSYFGDPDIVFGMSWVPRFETVFYNYNDIDEFIKRYSNNNGREKDVNIILSESMKTVIYSTNIETTPLTNDIFDFYEKHFPKIYDDGLIKVYRIYQGVDIETSKSK